MVDVLKKRSPPTLRWRAEITPGAVHTNNAQLATPIGFRYVFEQRQGDSTDAANEE